MSITIFLGTIIALYWGLVCSYGFRADRSKEARSRYLASLRTLCCLLLLSAVNVSKTMLAKLMSAHFYVEGYFDKMQDALRKVSLVPLLTCLHWARLLQGTLLHHARLRMPRLDACSCSSWSDHAQQSTEATA